MKKILRVGKVGEVLTARKGTEGESTVLMAFNPNGQLLWTSAGITGEVEVASPVIGADGVILLVSEEPGTLYAVGGQYPNPP